MLITAQHMTLEEFWHFDDGTDSRYELEEGVLLLMPPERDINLRIASFLLIFFAQIGIPPLF
jgi:Uma2 family endonuclease